MGLSTDTIDIPESGAVFTLGKSHLSENHQSYFFIKNDAIRRLICGRNQSAVVCESGRLFVWGENPFGQLGIGANEIVTKPSCVKTVKALGQRVRNVAFGETFVVILTESSQVFYSGRSVFNSTAAQFRERFWNLGNDLLVSRKPFELVDFGQIVHDAEDNLIEQLVDVSAGVEHFVVLTGSGKLYGWGSNLHGQLTSNKTAQDRPILISQDEHVRVVSCGRFCTAFISANNEIYVLGQLGPLQFIQLSQINTTSFEDLMYSIYLSYDDQIYLVINSGEIFRSVHRDGELFFEPHNVISENIRKICTGDGFVSIVTESNKLLTTFRERSSASSEKSDRLKSPRELRKFNRLEVLDAVSGQHHILVHGVQPSLNSQLILSSSSNDEDNSLRPTSEMNDLNRTYTKQSQQDDEEKSLLQTLRRCLTMKDNPNILARQNALFDSHDISPTLPENTKHTDNNGNNDNNNDSLKTENKELAIEAIISESKNPIEKSLSLNEFEKLERENASVDETRENIEAKESNLRSEVPSSAGSQKSSYAQTVFHVTPANPHLDEAFITEDPIKLEEHTKSIEDLISSTNGDDIFNILDKEMDALVVESDEVISVKTLENQVTFINEGVVQVAEEINSSESMKESDEPEFESIVLTNEQLEDNLLGEKMVGAKIATNGIDIKEKTKQAVKDAVDEFVDRVSPTPAIPRIKTPMPRLIAADLVDYDDGERTTASINSMSSTGKNPFEEDEEADAKNNLVAVESGRVKRFIRDMRTKGKGISCRNADNVVEEEGSTLPTKSLNPFEEPAEAERTSKVCTIL